MSLLGLPIVTTGKDPMAVGGFMLPFSENEAKICVSDGN